MPLSIPRNSCLIFFSDPQRAFTSARMQSVLRDAGLTVTGDAEPFAVKWGTGPGMAVSIDRSEIVGSYVQSLVRKRRRNEYRAISEKCDAMIRIELDNLEQSLDEINTLIEVQSALQDATNGLMYMAWNQNFDAPTKAAKAAVQSPPAAPISPPSTPAPGGRQKPDWAWPTCTNAGYLLGRVKEGMTDRKARLFACACCRAVWHLIDDPRAREAVELAEAFADGGVSDRQRSKAYGAIKAVTMTRENAWWGTVRQSLEKCANKYPSLIGNNIDWALGRDLAPPGTDLSVFNCPYRSKAEAMRAGWVRDIFRNPSGRNVLSKSWVTPAVLEEAQAIYQERAFDRMAGLGDLLAKAGCDEAELLEHCRAEGPHFRGCWVIDMILGKE